MRGEGARALEGRHMAVDRAKIVREEPRPGVPPKVDPMLDWRILFDQNSGRWVCYRSGNQSAFVETEELTLDAYCESRHGVLYSHCEMLVGGRTNVGGRLYARTAHLREVTEYPQELTINWNSARALDGGRALG